MKLSEHNTSCLLESIETFNYSNTYMTSIFRDMLFNPEKAILYTKNKLQHIRYVSQCIVENKDIVTR